MTRDVPDQNLHSDSFIRSTNKWRSTVCVRMPEEGGVWDEQNFLPGCLVSFKSMIFYYIRYTGVILPIIWKQLNCPFQAQPRLCHTSWNTDVITTSLRRETHSKYHFSYALSSPPPPMPLSSLLVRDSANNILKHFLHGSDMVRHVLIPANLPRKCNEDTVIS